jgi:acetyl esterase/lipase
MIATTRCFWPLCLSALCWLALAARAETVKDLPYKQGEKLSAYERERCKLDLYLPEQKPFATLVWFHGGGLTAGSKGNKETVAVAESLARGGIAVAAVNYRLSPKAKYPAYIEDGAAAVAWVKAHIPDYGGEPHKVFVGGHSAGAYLTLMLGLDDHYLTARGLRLQDLAGLVPVAGQTLTHFTIRQERGLPKNVIIADDAAPLHHARKDAPPMLILYAEKDMALRAEENLLLAAALRNEGDNRLTIKMIKGANHGSVGNNLAKDDYYGRELVLQFIRNPLSPIP